MGRCVGGLQARLEFCEQGRRRIGDAKSGERVRRSRSDEFVRVIQALQQSRMAVRVVPPGFSNCQSGLPAHSVLAVAQRLQQHLAGRLGLLGKAAQDRAIKPAGAGRLVVEA